MRFSRLRTAQMLFGATWVFAACSESSAPGPSVDLDPTRQALDAGDTDGATAPGAQGCRFRQQEEFVIPGGACNVDASGQTIPSAGACAPGTWVCVDNGSSKEATCAGSRGPLAEVCTKAGETPADENCDGTVDEGCACVLGESRSCGIGECSQGAKQTCIAGDAGAPAWGPCVGPAPKARDCTSAKDNDCNGKADRDEAFCACAGASSGPTALGASVPCGQFGSKGLCASVTRTCLISPDRTEAVWDRVCLGGVRICDSARDNDCNGKIDASEVGPCAPNRDR